MLGLKVGVGPWCLAVWCVLLRGALVWAGVWLGGALCGWEFGFEASRLAKTCTLGAAFG